MEEESNGNWSLGSVVGRAKGPPKSLRGAGTLRAGTGDMVDDKEE